MKRFLGLISFLLLQATCIGKDAGMLRATHDVQERIEGDINFLQIGVGALEGACEVCMYVVENKQQMQPFLCRGITDPSYQQTCTAVLVSLFWWMENEVYWSNYGCEKQVEGNWSFEKPCSAHTICGWLQNVNDKQPYCPPDANYRKPAAA